MQNSPLSIHNVTKRFGGKMAVDDVSFTVNPGEIIGFLGPNGAGKTTTLRMALGLIKPDEGEIKLFGGQPGHESAFGRIGFLPEERGLYKKQTARESIAHMARLNGVTKRKKNKDMSKGMAQKIQLLSAIAHNPEFYILDEPFSGLDPVNQQVLESMVREIAERDSTVIFSTHVMEHAERLCDRIILMAGGRKVFDGSTEDALSKAPRRMVIGSDTDGFTDVVTQFAKSVERRDDGALDLILKDKAKSQDVLERCVKQKVNLTRFEPKQATLHEAFVAMVGKDLLATMELEQAEAVK